jgi:PAS domain S-box-containing protein
VRLLTNPLFVRGVVVFVGAVCAFVIGAIAMRLLRRSIVDNGSIPDASHAEESLPLQAYTVIQQLKQQKFALQNEQQLERRRTKTTEHITAAIIANLPVGMLFIGRNGLVRQANPAARRILGFASPMGMNATHIFRESKAILADGNAIRVTDAFNEAMHGGLDDGGFEAAYVTPSGEHRPLEVTLIPVRTPGGDLLGLAAAVADHADAAALRQAQLLRAEELAELALELRTSLATIREWAEQIKSSGDVRGLATDISAETARLERIAGQFLAGKERTKATHA